MGGLQRLHVSCRSRHLSFLMAACHKQSKHLGTDVRMSEGVSHPPDTALTPHEIGMYLDWYTVDFLRLSSVTMVALS